MVHLLLAWVVKTIINPSDWSAIHLVNRNSMSHKKATETLVKQYRKTKKRPQTNSALTVTDFVPYTFVCFPMPFQFQLLHGNKKNTKTIQHLEGKKGIPTLIRGQKKIEKVHNWNSNWNILKICSTKVASHDPFAFHLGSGVPGDPGDMIQHDGHINS